MRHWGPVILVYHKIAHPPSGVEEKQYYMTPEDFERQMAYLSTHRYQVVRLEEVVRHIRKEIKLPGKCVVLTFDDGYRNNYVNAYPVLKKYGFCATFFLITDKIGQEWSKPGVTEKMLSWAEIEEMQRYGMEFGSHSCSHSDLTLLSPERVEEEIKRSKEKLEKGLKRPVKFFSYPYGKFNQEIKKCLKKNDYLGACSTIRGFNHSKTDPFLLKRDLILGSYNLRHFKRRLFLLPLIKEVGRDVKKLFRKK